MIFLAGILLSVSLLAGCIHEDLRSSVEGNGEGFVQVEVLLRSFGSTQGNVSSVSFSFSHFSLFEATTKQWMPIHANTSVTVALDGQERSMGSITLPKGKFAELRGTLEEAHVAVDGESVPAVVEKERCQTAINMDLTQSPAKNKLTLFFQVDDVLSHRDGQWYASPAFSGSFTFEGDAGQNDGSPRFGEPICADDGA